jgi:hypothetical protein
MMTTSTHLAAALLLLASSAAPGGQGSSQIVEQLTELGRIMNRPLPVYPGARLDFEDATERDGCAFTTKDPVGKVTAFYERMAKATVLDLPGLLKRFPEMAKGAALQRQPPGVTLRYLVFAEVGEGGRRAVDAMEVVCAGGACRFSIRPGRLLPADQHFGDEWRTHFAQAPVPRSGPAAQLAGAVPLYDPPGFKRQPISADEGEVPSIQVRWEQGAGRQGEDGGGGEVSAYVLTLGDLKGRTELLGDHLSVQGASGLKKVKVNGAWPGVELIEGPNDGLYHGERRFVVHGRYAVELVYDGRGSPLATLDRLCKELKVDELAR